MPRTARSAQFSPTAARLGARVALAVVALLTLVATDAPGQHYRTHKYSEQDGLPNRHAVALAQAPDGAVWVATRAGVTRFDGRNWSSPWLPRSDFVMHLLAVDDAGNAFVADRDQSVERLRSDGSFERLPLPEEALGGGVFIGLHVLSDGQTLALVTATAGVWLRDGDERWSHLAQGPAERIWGSVVAAGSLYVAGDAGLSRWSSAGWIHGLTDAAGLPEGPLLAVTAASDGAIWVAGPGWLGTLRNGVGEVRLEDEGLAFDVQVSRNSAGPLLMEDGAAGVWVGTQSLLFHMDGTTAEITPGAGVVGILGEGVSAMLHDRDGNSWFGTVRGLRRLLSLQFEVWDRTDGLLDDEVSAITEMADGRLIIGHNDGVSVIDGNGAQQLLVEPHGAVHSHDSRVLDAFIAPDQTLWLARSWHGLWSVDRTGDFRRHELPTSGGRAVLVSGVCREPDGRIWVATNNGVFVRENGQHEFTRFGLPSLPGGTDSISMARRVFAHAGELFIAYSDSGVGHRDLNGAWHRYRAGAPGAPHGNANSAYAVQTYRDRILVGTAAGLYEIEGERLVPVIAPGPEVSDSVYFLLGDEARDELWIGTQNGVVHWDGRNAEHFDVAQGLPAGETNRAAALVDSRGQVWFGTNGGLVMHRRGFAGKPPLPPLLGAPRLEVHGDDQPWNAGIELAHSDDDLTFEIPAVTFLDDGWIEFQVLLEGYDETWLPTSSVEGGRARYSRLPAGTYRLHARARGRRGPWSTEAVSPTLTISVPWWSQPWFAAVSGFALLGIIGLIARHQSQRIQAERLEVLVARRTHDLAEAEQRYREMFDKNGTPQLLVDPDQLRILAANTAAEQIWDAAPRALDGQAVSELLTDAPPELLERLMALQPGQRLNDDVTATNGDGATRHLAFEACAYELLDQRRVHVHASDVTERLRAERQLRHAQKMESLGHLAGGVAHDFNNLLTAVIGYAEHGLASNPGAVAEHLQDIVTVARRGSGMTRQLLGFARGHSGEPRVLDVIALVDELTPMLRHLLRDDVSVSFQRPAGSLHVRIDPGEMEQVLVNLAVNASDAMTRGGSITIEIVAGEDTENVRLVVSDTGEGMDPETLARAFEPFFTTKPLGRGTGLGLASCEGIISRAGGRMDITSREGIGTTVTVVLPRQIGVETADTSEGPPEDDSAPAPRLGTVLLVEDQDMVRDVASRSLRRMGHQVIEAPNGQLGLARAREFEGPIDLLLTDVVMPGMGGPELAEQLLNERPDIRVLYMSGYTADGLPETHLRPGEGALLQKPYRIADLEAAVSQALGSPAAT